VCANHEKCAHVFTYMHADANYFMLEP